jgi:predicted TIM-barrel fold metal-dependent hydrolase
VISADSHLDLGWLPGDTFTSRVPKAWRDRVPRIVDTGEGRQWVADGAVVSGVAGVGTYGRPYSKGRWYRGDRIAETGLYSDGLNRPADPELRLEDQDRDGISAEVIYGIFGIGVQIADLELVSVVDVTFNDWFAEFCAHAPDRLIGLANLPVHDAGAAAQELRRVAALGFRGVVFDVKNSYRPVYHEDWYPVWATAQEIGLPISFHTGSGRAEQGTVLDAVWEPTVGDPLIELGLRRSHRGGGTMDYFGIVLGGTLDAFPDLQIVLGEAGIGWIPTFLQTMDFHHENELHTLGLKMKPSEYWHRQMYATFEYDAVGLHQLDLLGDDRVMFASDYPHPSGVFPDSLATIDDITASLSDTARRNVVHDNAARVYGLT